MTVGGDGFAGRYPWVPLVEEIVVAWDVAVALHLAISRCDPRRVLASLAALLALAVLAVTTCDNHSFRHGMSYSRIGEMSLRSHLSGGSRLITPR